MKWKGRRQVTSGTQAEGERKTKKRVKCRLGIMQENKRGVENYICAFDLVVRVYFLYHITILLNHC